MPSQSRVAHVATQSKRGIRSSKHARKSPLFIRGVPSVTRSIADAICIKNGNIFFVAASDGNVPVGESHGFGLYYHDCRYLNGYQLRIANARPIVLAGATGEVGTATFELTNPHLEFSDGKQLPSGDAGIAWSRELDATGVRLVDTISIKSYAQGRVEFPITLKFDSAFEDVFTVRGLF